MSWFNSSGFASLAKSAFDQAQKTIDRALDIREDGTGKQPVDLRRKSVPSDRSDSVRSTGKEDENDFFAAFGVNDSGSIHPPDESSSNSSEKKLTTDLMPNSLWGSFTGSFFALGNAERSSTQMEVDDMTIASQPKKSSTFPNEAVENLQDVAFPTDKTEEYSLKHSRDGTDKSANDSISVLSDIDECDSSSLSTVSMEPLPTLDVSVVHSVSSSAGIARGEVLARRKKVMESTLKDSSRQVTLRKKLAVRKSSESLCQPHRLKESDVITASSSSSEHPTLGCETPKLSSLITGDAEELSDQSVTVTTESNPNILADVELDVVINVEQVKTSDRDMEVLTSNAPSAGCVVSGDKSCKFQPDESPTPDPDCADSSASPMKMMDSTAEFHLSSESLVDFDSRPIQLEMMVSDESVGAGSVLSEKDGHSSATLTPEVFSDSGESFVPLGMSGSWEGHDGDVDHQEIIQPLSMDASSEMTELSDTSLPTTTTTSSVNIDSERSCTQGDEFLSTCVVNEEPTTNSPSSDLSSDDCKLEYSSVTGEDDSDVHVCVYNIASGTSETVSTTEESEKLIDIPIETTCTDSGRIDDISSQTESVLVLSSPVSSSVSPASSSAIKSILEDAMTDSNATRAHSPHSTTSSSERSDFVKMESEQNSGHTSGDEVETTTSSDIEVISPNGESSIERTSGSSSSSLSPVKQQPGSMLQQLHQQQQSQIHGQWFGAWSALPVIFRTNGGSGNIHPRRDQERSESPASDSSSCRDVAIPLRPGISHYSSCNQGRRQRSISDVSSSMEDADSIHSKTDAVTLVEMTEVLQAREAKVLELSRENISLRDSVASYQTQLQRTEERHADEFNDVSTLTKEFTERQARMEKGLQQALKDKESLETELQKAKMEVALRVNVSQVEELLKEKEVQANELLQEGEQLSKKLLQQSNVIKKLRSKEKENENNIKEQKNEICELSREVDRVRKSLIAKEEVEKKQIDVIRQLTTTNDKLEKELNVTKNDLKAAEGKFKRVEISLEGANRELSEVHRVSVEKDTRAQEATLSAEMAAKEALRVAVEQMQADSRLEQECLLLQLEELRRCLSVTEDQARSREASLHQQIADLHDRLQEVEARNEELTQGVSAASRPLLRQIENLQSSLNSQTSSWERFERSLTSRLNEAQTQLAVAVEKERSVTARYADMSTRVASLETQNASLRQDKAQLQVLLENERTKVILLDDIKTKADASLESLSHTYRDEIDKIKREKGILERQLEIEKTALDAEKRRTTVLQDQLKEKEQRLVQINLEAGHRCSPSPSPSLRSSFSETFQSWAQDDSIDQALALTSSTTRMNLYESVRNAGPSSLIESFQSQLKQRDGEIAVVQNEVAQLSRVRESMAQELVKLTATNEMLHAKLEEQLSVRKEFEEMEKKYNALLQMYGEKVEEVEELRLDLQDVKEMYKAQIDELLEKT